MPKNSTVGHFTKRNGSVYQQKSQYLNVHGNFIHNTTAKGETIQINFHWTTDKHITVYSSNEILLSNKKENYCTCYNIINIKNEHFSEWNKLKGKIYIQFSSMYLKFRNRWHNPTVIEIRIMFVYLGRQDKRTSWRNKNMHNWFTFAT